MKVVIEITDADGEPYRDKTYLRAALTKMMAEGTATITSESWEFDVEIVGVVTAEDSPGDQLIMAVEPL